MVISEETRSKISEAMTRYPQARGALLPFLRVTDCLLLAELVTIGELLADRNDGERAGELRAPFVAANSCIMSVRFASRSLPSSFLEPRAGECPQKNLPRIL